MAMYDAAYRPGIMMRDDDMAGVRAGFLENAENTFDDASTHQFPSDEDESDIGGADEFSEAPVGDASMLQNIGVGAVGVAARVFQTGARLFYQQRQCVQMGEGPTLLRFLCFVGGLVMLLSSVLSMMNIFTLLTSPSAYVLQIYQGFFGVITMTVEAKDWDCFDRLKPWMTDWFRFLTVPAGKGAFYLFVGSLGVSLWVRNLLSFTVGLYMAFMGVVCIGVHAGTTWKPVGEDDYIDRFELGEDRGDPVHDALHSAFDRRYPNDVELGPQNKQGSTSQKNNGYSLNRSATKKAAEDIGRIGSRVAISTVASTPMGGGIHGSY